MLKKIGFDLLWIIWIRELVMTVSYFVIVKGQPYDFFKPQRGLRRGDSLSSYLFLFCVEGLSFLLHKTEQNNLIEGIQINRRCPKVNYLLFADDSILFCKANSTVCGNILDLLTMSSASTVKKLILASL